MMNLNMIIIMLIIINLTKTTIMIIKQLIDILIVKQDKKIMQINLSIHKTKSLYNNNKNNGSI